MNYYEITKCLACDSDELTPCLDLGSQPLANSFLDQLDQSESFFPLAVNLCQDCCHLQLTHAVNPDLMFKDYLYVSGTSQTLRTNMTWFSNFVTEYRNGKLGTVLDIGCNDGTQLDYFHDLGYTTHGIDPAKNLHQLNNVKHQVTCDYFGPNVFHKDVKFDVIVAQNVFAHNHNPLIFLKTVSELLSKDGIAFIQTSQADMILNQEFDTIYHEHMNFFNIKSMKKLADRAGINLIDVIKTPIHGTSYVFIFSNDRTRGFNIENLESLENSKGLYSINTYQKWASQIKQNMRKLKSQVDQYHECGITIVGYGAAAKGNTLINFSGINLDVVIDDNPLKQGKFTPGSHISVRGPDYIKSLSNKPVCFIPLAWNFYPEIVSRILKIRIPGDDVFLKYFPHVEVCNEGI